MAYGHADNIIHSGKEPGEDTSPADRPPEQPTVDQPATLAPDWYTAPELASVLCGHDIGALYRWLSTAGVSQRRIAALTGSTQPQIADIITGRRGQVQTYTVLTRIAEGLGIPRERMGLSFWGPDGHWYGPEGAYRGGATVTDTPEGVSTAMLRRHLLAQGGILLAGAPVTQLGELLDDLSEPPPVALPDRLNPTHVAQVQNLRAQLAAAGMIYGADPAMSSTAAATAEQLVTVPGADPVKRAMLGAVAHLHIHAGRAAFDGGLYARTLHHLTQALDLARRAEDPYLQALALNWAGLATIEHGHPDDGLKMLQCAQVAAWAIPADHARRGAVEACGLMDSATALNLMGHTHAADRQISKARELWTPTRTDLYGDLDLVPARLEITRGRLELAEQYATASLRRWDTTSHRARTESGIVLATIHVTAGEQCGLQLAHRAITDTTKLTSVRIRHQLLPLVEALETRPDSDARELAQMARQIAA